MEKVKKDTTENSSKNVFVNSFVNHAKGDDIDVVAGTVWRQAESALKTHISSVEGDSIGLEDAVESAKENLESAKVNNGYNIPDRDLYVQSLINAKNELTQAEDLLDMHKETLKFLKDTYVSLMKI